MISLLYGTIAEFRRSIFGTSSIVVQYHRLSNPTLHWLLCRGAFSYNMDAGAFDRMGEWLDPYGEYPDGTPCAYCNSCEGECRPQGWNLIGPKSAGNAWATGGRWDLRSSTGDVRTVGELRFCSRFQRLAVASHTLPGSRCRVKKSSVTSICA